MDYKYVKFSKNLLIIHLNLKTYLPICLGKLPVQTAQVQRDRGANEAKASNLDDEQEKDPQLALIWATSRRKRPGDDQVTAEDRSARE